MLTLRTRLFIIISLVILFILGVSLLLILKPSSSPSPADNTPSTSALNGGTPVPGGEGAPNGGGNISPSTVSPLTATEKEQIAARQTAKLFFERYNTYSTDGNFENIREVEPLVAAALWKQLSARIKPVSASASFVAMDTQVVATSIASWSDKAATILLSCRISDEKNSQITTRVQDAKVSVTRGSTGWLVEKFEWVK